MLRRTLLREAGLAEKLNCNTVPTKDSADPMAFQSCPKLKQEAWHLYTYIIPSVWAMPRRGHDLSRGSSLQTRPIPQKGRWVSLSWKVWQFWGAQHHTYYNKFLCISIAVIYSVNLCNLKLLFSIISFTIFTTVSSLLYSFKNSKMSVASSLLQCVSSGGDFVTHLVMSGDILDCFILGGGAC